MSLNSVSRIATNLVWALIGLLGMLSTSQLAPRSCEPDPHRGGPGRSQALGSCLKAAVRFGESSLQEGGSWGCLRLGAFFLHLAVI